MRLFNQTVKFCENTSAFFCEPNPQNLDTRTLRILIFKLRALTTAMCLNARGGCREGRTSRVSAAPKLDARGPFGLGDQEVVQLRSGLECGYQPTWLLAPTRPGLRRGGGITVFR